MSRHSHVYISLDVGNGAEQDRDVIAEMTQAVVAVPAQQSPEMAVSMVVVHDEEPVAPRQPQARLPRLFLDPADGTAPTLRLEKGVVFLHGDAVLAKLLAAAGLWAPRSGRALAARFDGAGNAPVLTTSATTGGFGAPIEAVDGLHRHAAGAAQFRSAASGCERGWQSLGCALARTRAVTALSLGSLRRRRAPDRRPADLAMKAGLRGCWRLHQVQQGTLRKLHSSRLRIRCGRAPERFECYSTPARGVNSYSHSIKILSRDWLISERDRSRLRTLQERG